MVGGIESNVVDGPISWRAPSTDLRGRKKTDHFGPREAGGGTRAGLPEQNYVGLLRRIRHSRPWLHFSKYCKRSTCGFAGAQFAVVGDGRFIVVNRHSFEMALNQ